jgi:hypothetical protein
MFSYGEAGFSIDPSLRGLLFSAVNGYTGDEYAALEAPNDQLDHLSFIANLYPAAGLASANIMANGLSDECTLVTLRHHTEQGTTDGLDYDYLLQVTRGVLGFLLEASMFSQRVPRSSFPRPPPTSTARWIR